MKNRICSFNFITFRQTRFRSTIVDAHGLFITEHAFSALVLSIPIVSSIFAAEVSHKWFLGVWREQCWKLAISSQFALSHPKISTPPQIIEIVRSNARFYEKGTAV